MIARLVALLRGQSPVPGVPRLLGNGVDAIIQHGDARISLDARRGRYERACFVLNVSHRSPASFLLWKVRVAHGAMIRKDWRAGRFPRFALLQGWRTKPMEIAL